MRPLVTLALSLALVACAGDEEPQPDAEPTPTPQREARETPIRPGDGQRVPGVVQEVFDTTCVGCHGGAGRLPLDAERAYANLVDRPSHQLPSMLRVSPGEPRKSYLLHKLLGSHLENGGHGARMPDGGSWGADGDLSDQDIVVIREWIRNGAPAAELK